MHRIGRDGRRIWTRLESATSSANWRSRERRAACQHPTFVPSDRRHRCARDRRRARKIPAICKGSLPDASTQIFNDPAAPRTVLIVPSLSVDQQVMAKISGAHHYEERMLCLLLLLRHAANPGDLRHQHADPRAIIDYYLHLLPGIPSLHARRRLTLVSCNDASPAALTRKILERPRVLERIREAIPDLGVGAHDLLHGNRARAEACLALDLPIYGCDPSLLHWGSKSGSRKIFREAGIDLPLGFEDLADAERRRRRACRVERQKARIAQSGGQAQRRILRRGQCDLRPRGRARGRVAAAVDPRSPAGPGLRGAAA